MSNHLHYTRRFYSFQWACLKLALFIVCSARFSAPPVELGVYLHYQVKKNRCYRNGFSFMFPAEPCTRRSGTLYSRAVLYPQLYCSQLLFVGGDKSTDRQEEVCKPLPNLFQAPLINCRSQSSGYHALSRILTCFWGVITRRSQPRRRTSRRNKPLPYQIRPRRLW